MLKWRTVSGSEKQSTYDATRRFRILPVLAGLCLAFLFGQERCAQAQGFADTGSMGTARQYHTATLLNYSGVLVTGGFNGSSVLNSAELYNPGAGTFTPIDASMNSVRRNHKATRLNNGRVLITGGTAGTTGSSVLNSAELYDPSTRAFTSTGNMNNGSATAYLGRFLHTATLLNNGKVLITGGRSGNASGTTSNSTNLNTAEVYDPATGNFTPTANTMNQYRAYHTATLLNDGRVLIAGGITRSGATGTAEIYDPTTNQFSPVTGANPAMATARGYHAAVLLNDGTVLITGGAAGSLSTSIQTAQIFTPAAYPVNGTFSPEVTMQTAHSSHTATLLTSGNVLIAGSLDYDSNTQNYIASNAAEIYYPGASGGFFSAGTMNTARGDYPAVLLDNGTVLLAGGRTPTATTAADIYDPASILVTPAGNTFPDTAVNATSPSQSFKIENKGLSDLSVSSIVISGTDSAMFALTGSCGIIAAGGSCSVSVTFHPTSAGMKYASLDINSDDPEIPTWTVPLSGTGILATSTSTVTVTFAGTGSGSVHSSPAGIACSGGSGTTCQSSFTNGTTVTLIPTGDNNTLFGSWSGACTGTGDCVINNLSTNSAATATFNYINPAKIVRTQLTYATLMGAQGAYTAALNNDVIQTRAHTFAESPNFTGGKSITINGGYDLTYSPNSNIGNYSVISGGSFTIGTGQITLSNIIIQ